MDDQKIHHLAQQVINIESQMIGALAERIDQHFIQACHVLFSITGRIVVMGVGKSGHIGKKIAATFASTGSPAFFIHPNEASHGDMGMLTPQDALLVLSNSGESAEILAILPAIKRLNIPLIALTGRPHSKLAQAATVNLDVSVSQEACPLGLAPTSSTTAALVMGDALAMVLLEKRGFTVQDFAFSHPGGMLGKRLLLQVEALMHKEAQLPVVGDHVTLKEALLEMTQKKLGMTAIINHDRELRGIFTDGDLRRVLGHQTNPLDIPIAQLMSPTPKTIHKHALVTEAIQLMENHQITALVVINESTQPIGVIHIHDILHAGIA